MKVTEAIARTKKLLAYMETMPSEMYLTTVDISAALSDIPAQPCIHLGEEAFSELLVGREVNVVRNWSSDNNLLWCDCDGVTVYRLRGRDQTEIIVSTETVD